MTYPFPYGSITVTRERPVYDRFNDVDHYDELVIPGCIDFPSGTTEGAQNTVVTDDRTLIAPAGSDITAIDRLVLHDPGSATPPANPALRRAATFQVIGLPKDWEHLMTGWKPGMTVELRKVT